MLTEEQRIELHELGNLYNLQFIVLHGSYATGKTHSGSDLDIAVLGKHLLSRQELTELYGKLSTIFGDCSERELDLASLHKADPLFLYYVVKQGVLLYGDKTSFLEFQTYAKHLFEDAKKLFELEKFMIIKQNNLILKAHQHA